MNMLIVDDSEDIRLLLWSILKDAGYNELFMADSAKDAYKQLGIHEGDSATSDPPDIDLVLMDVAMQGIDGIEACQRIKQSERYNDVPIIMVTAMNDGKLLEVAFDAGAHDYIKKPFKKVELLARVRSALRLKEEIDHRKAHEQELVEANRQLKMLSFIDGLTGIPNRRHFDERIDMEWRREKRHDEPLSLILIDIDFFKTYNDEYGHPAGDDCLNRVATRLKSTFRRPGDFIARYGGEEFVALLPETNGEGALKVAERLRIRIEEMHIAHLKSEVSAFVTISLGVATVKPDKNQTVEDLIKAADKALYQAKTEGRNRVKTCV